MRKNRRLGIESLESRIALAAGPFLDPALLRYDGIAHRADRQIQNHPIWDVPGHPYLFANPLYFDDFTNDGVTDVLSRNDSEYAELSGMMEYSSLASSGGDFETDHAELLGKADLNNDGWLDLLCLIGLPVTCWRRSIHVRAFRRSIGAT